MQSDKNYKKVLRNCIDYMVAAGWVERVGIPTTNFRGKTIVLQSLRYVRHPTVEEVWDFTRKGEFKSPDETKKPKEKARSVSEDVQVEGETTDVNDASQAPTSLTSEHEVMKHVWDRDSTWPRIVYECVHKAGPDGISSMVSFS